MKKQSIQKKVKKNENIFSNSWKSLWILYKKIKKYFNFIIFFSKGYDIFRKVLFFAKNLYMIIVKIFGFFEKFLIKPKLLIRNITVVSYISKLSVITAQAGISFCNNPSFLRSQRSHSSTTPSFLRSLGFHSYSRKL